MPKLPKIKKIRCHLGVNFKKKFIIDILIIFSLINGIICSSNQVQINDFKNLESKYAENSKKFQHLVSRTLKKPNSGRDAMAVFIVDKDSEEVDRSQEQRRSFQFSQRFVGHRKRLQFALLPIMYKMGVMTTLLTGLTVFALKGLTIGLILLMFSLGNYFLKYHKQWNPSSGSGQPIHVHVHAGDKAEKYVKFHEEDDKFVSSPWDREEVQDKYFKPFDKDNLDSYRNKYYHNSADSYKFSPNV